MAGFPINLCLEGRLCVVVGGGAVGRRKAVALRAAGGRVRLISPGMERSPDLANIEVEPRPYQAGDLAGAFLAVAATDDHNVNAAVARDARRAGVLVNVADAPEEGDFTMPALLRRGDVSVAVSTAGRSPAFAAVIRDWLAEDLGPEWSVALEIASVLRENKLTLTKGTEYNREVLRRLLAAGLPSLIADGRSAEIDRLLAGFYGEGCSLAGLGIRLPKGKT